MTATQQRSAVMRPLTPQLPGCHYEIQEAPLNITVTQQRLQATITPPFLRTLTPALAQTRPSHAVSLSADGGLLRFPAVPLAASPSLLHRASPGIRPGQCILSHIAPSRCFPSPSCGPPLRRPNSSGCKGRVCRRDFGVGATTSIWQRTSTTRRYAPSPSSEGSGAPSLSADTPSMPALSYSGASTY